MCNVPFVVCSAVCWHSCMATLQRGGTTILLSGCLPPISSCCSLASCIVPGSRSHSFNSVNRIRCYSPSWASFYCGGWCAISCNFVIFLFSPSSVYLRNPRFCLGPFRSLQSLPSSVFSYSATVCQGFALAFFPLRPSSLCLPKGRSSIVPMAQYPFPIDMWGSHRNGKRRVKIRLFVHSLQNSEKSITFVAH